MPMFNTPMWSVGSYSQMSKYILIVSLIMVSSLHMTAQIKKDSTDTSGKGRVEKSEDINRNNRLRNWFRKEKNKEEVNNPGEQTEIKQTDENPTELKSNDTAPTEKPVQNNPLTNGQNNNDIPQEPEVTPVKVENEQRYPYVYETLPEQEQASIEKIEKDQKDAENRMYKLRILIDQMSQRIQEISNVDVQESLKMTSQLNGIKTDLNSLAKRYNRDVANELSEVNQLLKKVQLPPGSREEEIYVALSPVLNDIDKVLGELEEAITEANMKVDALNNNLKLVRNCDSLWNVYDQFLTKKDECEQALQNAEENYNKKLNEYQGVRVDALENQLMELKNFLTTNETLINQYGSNLTMIECSKPSSAALWPVYVAVVALLLYCIYLGWKRYKKKKQTDEIVFLN
jgi:hypothetical protein